MASDQSVRDNDDRSWFRTAFRAIRAALGELMVASLAINVLTFAVPVFILQVYDRVIAQAGLTTLQGLVIGMAGVVVFDFIMRQARGALLRESAAKLDSSIGQSLFDKIMSLPLRHLEVRPTAYWQALFRDVDHIRSFMSGAAVVAIADVPFAILGIVLISLVAPPVTAVLYVAIPVFILLAWRAGAVSTRHENTERKATSRRDALLGDLIGARTTVKAVGGSTYLRRQWERRQADTIAENMERGASGERYHHIGHSMQQVTLVAIASIGAIGILDQTLTIGALVAANMIANRVIQPLNLMVAQFRAFSQFRQSLARLDQVFNLPSTNQERSVNLQRPKGRIALEKVIFRYARDDQQNAIEGVSAGFGPNGLHAVVGPNGSGKSTLLKLMRGLYGPLSGRVLLDEGDLAQFSDAECHGWIGYVPQSTRLISGPIKANLVMGGDDPSDEELVRATTLAGAHADILALPGGYATPAGENGDNLPGGLRQRLAIARALVGDPPALLMDEPTNDLDPEATTALITMLKSLSKDHTVVVATHSLDLLEACDNILVLEKGRVKGGGPAFEVLNHLQSVGVLSQRNPSGDDS
ncbi:MAG: peptidase domain-containing ABC transporter [Rhodospirillales bacterium]